MGAPEADAPGPPPRPDAGDEARSAAARWLAGLGAALLVAAAGAFLAATWDALTLPARIGIVAGLTGAAILVGHQLRRRLPAVGTALFHLGGVLVPVDVLGLALYLDAGVGMRTLAVGASAALVLPVLAAVGRSRVLGALGIAAWPVVVTGVALLVPLPVLPVAALVASILVVLGAVAAGSRARAVLVDPAIAAHAVAVALAPMVVALVAGTLGEVGVVGTWVQAGWATRSWPQLAGAGVLVTAALAWRAHHHRSDRDRTLAIAVGALWVLDLVVLAPTPRLALLLVPGTVLLAVEVLARQRPTGGLRTLTGLIEIVALSVALGGGWLVGEAVPARVADPELALGILVAGLAWFVAAERRDAARPASTVDLAALVPVIAAIGVLHLVVAAVVVLPATWLTGAAGAHTLAVGAGAQAIPSAVALVGAALIVAREIARERRRVQGGQAGDQDVVRMGWTLAASIALAAVALGRTVPIPFALTAMVVVVGLLGAQTMAAVRLARRRMRGIGWVAAVTASLVILAQADTVTGGAPVAAIAALVAVVVAAGLFLWAVDGLPAVADTFVALLAVLGLSWSLPAGTLAVFAGGGLVGDPLRDDLVALGLGPSGYLPALALSVVLALTAVRSGRSVPIAAASLVLVRVLATGGFALGIDRAGVATLLAVVAVVGIVAVLRLPAQGPALLPLPVGAGALALLLTADLALARPLVLGTVGITLVTIGVVARRAWVGHLGGLALILATWSALDIVEVVTADAWLAPIALHLWIAGVLVRRREPMSSWLADVPPLLLVLVPAVIERLVTGAVIHGLVAGILALLAVLGGAWWRKAGPLVVGTVGLLVVVAIETLTVLDTVSVWIWLAIGGVVLFAAAAIIERTGSPATAGRRLVRVLEERFD